MLKIKEFCDMNKFEAVMKNWAKATGLATVAVGDDGEYISGCYNFTDFCIKLTRGSQIGLERCTRCDREGRGIYNCHAGLIDFGIDLVIEGQKVGAIIGGQVLPQNPNYEYFRQVAREIEVDEDEYIEALKKVNVRSREAIESSAYLLGEVLNNFINAQYNELKNKRMIETLTEGVTECEKQVESISRKTRRFNTIQQRQVILSLNARIEAAKAGEAGLGFDVVAQEVEKLSNDSKELNDNIVDNVKTIQTIVHNMANVNSDKLMEGKK